MDPAAFAVARLRPEETGDLRWEESESLVLAWSGRHPEAALAGSHRTGSARVSGTRGSSLVGFADLAEVDDSLRRAAASARCLQAARRPFARAAVHIGEYDDGPVEDPFDQVPLGEKVALLQGLQHRALESHPRIEGATLYYREQDSRLVILTSEGSQVTVRRREFVLQLTVHAQGDRPGTGTVSLGAGASLTPLRGLAAEVEAACQTAVDLCAAPDAPAGEMDVVLAGPLAAVWAHETVGHLSEADHQVGDPRLAEELHFGRTVAQEDLTICDGPGEPGARGYLPVDDEGTLGRVVRLVDRGRIGALLHSRATAAELGQAPTGNGRAVGAGVMPIPRLRTTWIEPADSTLEEIIARTERGLLAEGAVGGQTDRLSFVLLPVACHLIEDGAITGLVRPATISGDVLSALARVDLIGSTLEHRDLSASCGKQGQWPLPVSSWAPPIRIRRLQVTPG